MELNHQPQGAGKAISYAVFADALEREIVRIVAALLLRVLDREIPRPLAIEPDTIEILYLDYLKNVLESDMVKVALGNNLTVFLSLEQLREAMR